MKLYEGVMGGRKRRASAESERAPNVVKERWGEGDA